jgi:hypothetical protein
MTLKNILCRLFVLSMLICGAVGCMADAPTYGYEGTDSPDWEVARWATITEWELVYGRLPDDCYNESRDVIIEVLSPEEVSQACRRDYLLPACRVTQIRQGGDKTFFFVSEESSRLRRMESVVHEYIHFFQWCAQAIDDPDHECEVCWELRSGEQSIEFLAESQLYLFDE